MRKAERERETMLVGKAVQEFKTFRRCECACVQNKSVTTTAKRKSSNYKMQQSKSRKERRKVGGEESLTKATHRAR